MTFVVGFHGQLGSGKDTAAERLAHVIDMPTSRVAFADKLKLSAARLFGIDPDDWNSYKNDPDVKVYLTDGYTDVDRSYGVLQEPYVVAELTAREFLQRYGTEAHRDVFKDDFWVEQAFVDVPYGGVLTVTDVRFPNEVEAIHRRGGVVVRVLGPEDKTEAVHASEKPLEGVDYVIDNTVRNDDFRSLDAQLATIAFDLHLPISTRVLS